MVGPRAPKTLNPPLCVYPLLLYKFVSWVGYTGSIVCMEGIIDPYGPMVTLGSVS